MGYEVPVEMPSMGVYNTDLMKMYIAGVKDQYEKGQGEMKDFMKLYGDFYSPIAGDTQAYTDMTIGGARDMINQMMAAGIDPYKSPEARAAISRYIASRPTGVLNAMKQNAENRKAYDQAVAQARLAGKLDPEYEQWALKQAGLDNFSTVGPNGEIRIWDRLAPDPKQQWADVAAPYLKEFDKTEKLDSDVKGYTKWGVSDANKKAGVDAVMNAANSTPWLQYKLQQAYDRTAGLTDQNGAPLSEEQRRTLAEQDVRRQAEDTAAQYYQPKYETDPFYLDDYRTNNEIKKYWRTTGANPKPTSGKSPGSAKPGEEGYIPLFDSVQRALTDIFMKNPYTVKSPGFLSDKEPVVNSYKDVQDRIINDGKKKKLSAQNILKGITRSDDSNRYAEWFDRKPIDGSGNVVAYELGDENSIYSAAELLRMAGYINGPGKQGASMRTALRKKRRGGYKNSDGTIADPQNIRKTDLGGVIPLQIGKNIRVFKPIEVLGQTMYEDTGYVLDEQGRMLEDKSISAHQRDVNVGRKQYGMKQTQQVDELNM